MSEFKRMKKYLNTDRDCTLCYDSPYSEYMDGLYFEAISKLADTYEELFIEPSIQCGMGGVFATFVIDGRTYETHWDFECECETLEEMAMECETEEELINAIKGYIESHLEDAECCDEDEEYFDDEEDE